MSEISTKKAAAELLQDNPPVILDIREPDELQQGYLKNSINVTCGLLESKIAGVVPDHNTPIILYCAHGTRSLLAAKTLVKMGYQKVVSMAGGFEKWKSEQRLFETLSSLSALDTRRYARHLSIPEIGEKGQKKLLESSVLVIGAGGLGSPVSFYLAASGVGRIGIVDFDMVDESNMQRQILHTTSRIGTSKVQSAVHTLSQFNPHIKLSAIEEKITETNVRRILSEFEYVVDGSDNFPTRYLINDACVKLRKPLVHGSIYRFEGLVTVFDLSNNASPCYRCLYKEPPQENLCPPCREAGVLGVLPGVIGLLQATETIKLVLNIGTPLVGRLLNYDALSATFREFQLAKNAKCICAGRPEHHCETW